MLFPTRTTSLLSVRDGGAGKGGLFLFCFVLPGCQSVLWRGCYRGTVCWLRLRVWFRGSEEEKNLNQTLINKHLCPLVSGTKQFSWSFMMGIHRSARGLVIGKEGDMLKSHQRCKGKIALCFKLLGNTEGGQALSRLSRKVQGNAAANLF